MVLQAQVVLPYSTNLPKDVAVNTFHCTFGLATPEAAAASFSDRLVDFYNEEYLVTNSVAEHISSVVSRTADACKVRVFDLAEPQPRQPIHEQTFTLGPAGGGPSLPLEVALCLSYQAEPQSGMPQSRRRGRIYIGPLDLGVSTSSSGQIPRPSGDVKNALQLAAEALATGGAGDTTWCVYSRVNAAAYTIVNGWIDDDFDSQRRRGPSATARSLWSA